MRFIDTSRIRTRFDERVLANDGTELSVDLYFPPEQGSYPVLFQRTPADNNRAGRVGYIRCARRTLEATCCSRLYCGYG